MKRFEYIVYVLFFALFLLFGVLLILELVIEPDLVGIIFLMAMTGGCYKIKEAFEERIKTKKKRKFRSRFRK